MGILVHVNAAAFGLFFVSPSPERARLVASFDSDYPGTAVATKFISDPDSTRYWSSFVR